ncbi:hypothetical protein [Frigoribacterium salinisoli]
MSDSWTDDLAGGPTDPTTGHRLGRSEAAKITHLGVRRFGTPRLDAALVSFDDRPAPDLGLEFECSVDEGDRRGWIAVRDGALTVGTEPGTTGRTFPTGVRAWWLADASTDGSEVELVVDGPPLSRTPVARIARPGLRLALVKALGPPRTA